MTNTQCGDSSVLTITTRLRALIVETLKLEVKPESIDGGSNLYEFGLDSLNVVGLLTAIEAAFNVAIDVDDLSSELFNRFDNLVTFVQRKIDAAQ